MLCILRVTEMRHAIAIIAVVLVCLATSCGIKPAKRSSADSPNKQMAFKQLTPEILSSIQDEELEQVIVDHVFDKMAANYDKEREVLSELPQGARAMYLTWIVEAEVNNGGFNQYYWNSSGKFASEAVGAFEFFSAIKHAGLMREANQIRSLEAAQIERLKEQRSLEAFSESYKVSKLGPLDDRFYKLDENLSALRIARIRSSPELFCEN